MKPLVRVLYRGPLDACNYGCTYCPFAKKAASPSLLTRDRRALERFVARVLLERDRPFGVFFTPWGEALVEKAYRDAIVALSHGANVERVAIQTNLSAPLGFLDGANPSRVALWATYHPEWTTRARFVRQVERALAAGATVSCGVVGFRRFLDEIEALRRALPGEVYLWINAVKSTPAPEPYDERDLARLVAVDPHVSTNLVRHASEGRSCRTGASVITVDGDGVIRRCHFVPTPLGNFFDDSLERVLGERPCPNATCGCHIGYVHLDDLGLASVYGDGILERVPRRLPVVRADGLADA
ncbi:MAG: radical SAM protein [Myxococcales bacterium]|nr:radical SAM protein [Myxococcales bacterium]